MPDANQFIRLMKEEGVLQFGDFTLKSGKKSPYFFNLGNVSSGNGLTELGRAYAQCILDHDLQPEILYGPAYKGIPFAVTTAVALASRGVQVGVAFNRKELKGYGEGGWLIGEALDEKRVILIDDVVVDGGTKIEAAEMIRNEGGILCGMVLGIDRLEYANKTQTATESLMERLRVSVHAVSDLRDVLAYLESDPLDREWLHAVREYASKNCKL
ncbi:MAG: orotate phosphoribosyltransferase [Gammaproteobacteria bacterium]|nr:orotate phosphoribosyltransferase [Gammaproteobacteria bacterium]